MTTLLDTATVLLGYAETLHELDQGENLPLLEKDLKVARKVLVDAALPTKPKERVDLESASGPYAHLRIAPGLRGPTVTGRFRMGKSDGPVYIHRAVQEAGLARRRKDDLAWAARRSGKGDDS